MYTIIHKVTSEEAIEEAIEETIENLSHATLAKIDQVRAKEADGQISTKEADRHIRVIIGDATGKGLPISKYIDMTQMSVAYNRINRILAREAVRLG